ncbi:type 1 glutamine amidotransferase domain-containing protein [Leptospira bouyouniensis]|uniref:type 1 glutamine amidotransferase domain-containing protein n=1 Tax=Leptospira bouyouniensis TaxID=2484911 RepID=UPI001091658C|nr:type 1 glutamine amidotransferase domain-containing protein [Leptospira bouyouniensis]TGM87830.1 type 1 glutamine amidotransferase domain-containing protein [Leptospira bouyouniensis]
MGILNQKNGEIITQSKENKDNKQTDFLGWGKFRFYLVTLCLTSLLPSGLMADPEGKPKILVVMSASDTILLDGVRKHPTGVFLNELYFPVKMLHEKGFEIVFATPFGKKTTIDPESTKEKYWKSNAEKEEAIQLLSSFPTYKKPITLEKAIGDNHTFLGILVPGGQGLMTDLLYDGKIPQLLKIFHEKQKPIGLVCHAPALLTTLHLEGENEHFIFKGYKVNSVTKIEEWFIETFVMKGTPKVRNISGSLKDLGMDYKSSFLPGRSYAIRDRNLITSQNPFSGIEFSELFWEAIQDYLQKNVSSTD